jgi:leucyl aminopeptidase
VPACCSRPRVFPRRPHGGDRSDARCIARGNCADARHEVEGAKRSAPASFTLLNGGSQLDTARTVAIDRGNHLARWLTALPPNVLNTSGYRKALRDLARRQGWQFDFLNEASLRRRNAGAFLAVARANQQRDAGIVRLRYRAAQRKNVGMLLSSVRASASTRAGST